MSGCLYYWPSVVVLPPSTFDEKTNATFHVEALGPATGGNCSWVLTVEGKQDRAMNGAVQDAIGGIPRANAFHLYQATMWNFPTVIGTVICINVRGIALRVERDESSGIAP